MNEEGEENGPKVAEIGIAPDLDIKDSHAEFRVRKGVVKGLLFEAD